MMTTKAVVVLLGLCVVLTTAKPAADTSLSLSSAVESETAAANKALAALSAACTSDSARSIQEAKIKMFGDLASCSVAAIIKNIAYIMIDSADFGSAVWDDALEIVDSFKACSNETGFLDKLECLDDALFSTGKPLSSINDAAKQLVGQLIDIIPKLSSEFKSCRIRSTNVYNSFLDSLVKKATTCETDLQLSSNN